MREEGFIVEGVATGAALLDRVEQVAPAALVIDIGLPDADGRDVCQALRARGIQTPVLFLTARDALVDRISGFDAGGDDYLAKPFAFVELVARLEALLRRSGGDGTLEAFGLQLDPVSHSAADATREVALTPTEFRLLARLMSRPGEAVRRRELVRAGWPHGAIVRENTLDAYVARLRRKLEAARARARDRDRPQRRLPHRMSRLGLRRRLVLVVGVAVAVALLGLIAGFNLMLSHVLDRDASDLARARAAGQIDSIRTDGGRLSISPSPDDRTADAYLWIFSGTRALERPRVPAAVDGAARDLAGGSGRFHDVGESDVRLYAAPVVVHGKRLGTVVAGVSLAPYEQTRKLALLASLILGALVLVLVVATARWLIGASLRPVVRMTRQAAEWSEYDLEHRFALGAPHDELTELAATLDGLLDRLAASLRHERRFSAELSHELRTPLARVLAEAEVALRRDREPAEYRQTLELIQKSAGQLSRTVDALVAAARYEAGGERGTADALAVANEAARTCAGLANERQMELEVERPRRAVRVGIDADLAERILQPVLENACRYGSSRVHVAIGRENSSVVYAIEDDGPGVTDVEHDHIFEPGVRGQAPREDGDGGGAGLGLSLARRLARSVDGDVVADAAATGGRFLVRLPTG